ncbi:MAG: adenylosuccinate lyase [Candidatus Methanofastidiosa archaeon]|nr:adenylosuccinate lyase [Candidatus Methanofastidiosa archaeon]
MIHPIDYRYGSPHMRTIFEEDTRIQLLLDVEAAIALAHARLGHIPQEAADEIAAKARLGIVPKDDILAEEKKINHDIMAMVKVLAAQCGEWGRYVHFGATSNDINDTASAIQFRDALALVLEQVAALKAVLERQARTHIGTVCVGRTHAQHAIPTTYGMKFALFLDELMRNEERLRMALSHNTGKVAGAVGTMASYDDGIAMREEVGRILGIPMAPITNQVVARDIYAEILTDLALLASLLDKMATEVRNLQRTEIGEAAEGFKKDQVGSSTMPHKKNPISSEKTCGLARILYGNVIPALLNNVLWHERDLSNSAPERAIIPESFILMDEMLRCMVSVYGDLVLFPESIGRNLRLTGGKNLAEAVMIALTKKGASRQDAHEILRSIALSGDDFVAAVKGNADVKAFLSDDELDALLVPERYIGEARRLVEDVLSRV